MKRNTVISRSDAVQRIREHGSKFTAIVFTKRTDGTLRRIKFRTGVTAYLKGGTKSYDAEAHQLITVFDMDLKEYRSIPIEGIRLLKVDGKWLKVV